MTNTSIADVLEKAADLIEPEGAWTQGAFAKDQLGNEYLGYEESGDIREFGATCFCVFGALAIAEGVIDPEWARLSEESLRSFLGFKYAGEISHWNDTEGRTQAEVVSALRAAASLARAAS